MKVRLKRGWSKAWPEFTVGNVYRVLGIEADMLRLITDAGEPLLFDARGFEVVDSVQPADWISVRGEQGEQYAAPRELSEPRHFYELWHDGDSKIRSRLQHYVSELARAERALMADPPNIFIRVQGKRDRADDPITLFIELDEERWEVRRVEVFADGRLGYASERGTFGPTTLGDGPLAANPEFSSSEITRAEFETIFDEALTAEEAAG